MTLAEFTPLTQWYTAGEMTHRATAEIRDISRAAVFGMLREVFNILAMFPDPNPLSPVTIIKKRSICNVIQTNRHNLDHEHSAGT